MLIIVISTLLGSPMPTPNDTQAAYVIQDESRMMTRAEAAASRRTLADTDKALVAIQRNLLNMTVSETNVDVVSQQLMAASRLRETLKQTKSILLASLPDNTGAKLSEQEQKEISGYYATGNYTQNQLAEQYQVSQATIHNVTTKSKVLSSEVPGISEIPSAPSV